MGSTASQGPWAEPLLGQDRFALAGIIDREAGEDKAAAATQVWTATEREANDRLAVLGGNGDASL